MHKSFQDQGATISIIRILLWIVFVLICFPVFSVQAALQEVVLQQEEDQAFLIPAPRHARITKLVVGWVTNHHYRETVLDNVLSARILAWYIETLDPNRSFFLEDDVRYLQFLYEDRLDDALQAADMAPAFEIFKIYKKRVAARVRKAVHLVGQDFNFTIDENYIPDRTERPWPASALELDEIWRKRVKNDVLTLRLEKKKDAIAIRKTLRKRYETLLRSVRQFTSDDVCQLFINAYAASVGPHTRYFSPRNSENLFINLSQSLEGIGAVLQSDNEYTVVRKIIHGGPADKDGKLQVDDVITGVGQNLHGEMVDVVGWRLQDVVNLIRGPKDSIVRLQILEGKTGLDGPAKQISLIRNRVDLADRIAKKSVIKISTENGDLRIGVIELPTFYAQVRPSTRKHDEKRSSTHDVQKLIDDLRKETVDGIVLDLRGNGGGSLNEAINLTGLFLESGPIVQIKESNGRFLIKNDPYPGMAWSGPLVVLVDQGSASASEIFTGAIQDYRRGLIVGETTHGKGTVQQVISLMDETAKNNAEDMGHLKLTIAQFFRVNGASTQYRGIVPDMILPSVENSADQGERAFKNALPWASISPAKFSYYASLDDVLIAVRAKHENRMMREPIFDLLREELAVQREARSRTQFTLREAQRREERKARKDMQEVRKNRFRVALGSEKKPDVVGSNDIEEEPIVFEVILREAATIAADMAGVYRN
uniref:Carboxyl-terminal processing protease n=1 Tax=Candidatus Kentrum sp. TUN TaxID=2126343 RepID=A0A451A338_9GAMM|nr:MAG: carboxyl-terminal processing protease [Candidatus Kentron sp. TUN]VFK60444.1 MAG: carboxyl-terminal processing protease [Candidatus Kentron sp. TUN]